MFPFIITSMITRAVEGSASDWLPQCDHFTHPQPKMRFLALRVLHQFQVSAALLLQKQKLRKLSHQLHPPEGRVVLTVFRAQKHTPVTTNPRPALSRSHTGQLHAPSGLLICSSANWKQTSQKPGGHRSLEPLLLPLRCFGLWLYLPCLGLSVLWVPLF